MILYMMLITIPRFAFGKEKRNCMTLSFAAIVFLVITAIGFNYCQVLDKSFSKCQQKVLVVTKALILFSQ